MHPLRRFATSIARPRSRRHGITQGIFYSTTLLITVLVFTFAMFFLNVETAQVDDSQQQPALVLGMLQETVFDGEDHIEVEHDASLELPQGTFAMRFAANDMAKKQGLFSKDFTDNRDGGDFTAFVDQGRIKVRLQSANDEVVAKTPEGSVQPGKEYHLAVTFGPRGLWVYLDGRMMAWQPEFTQGLEHNTRDLAIGANTWHRTEKKPYRTQDHFAGTISEFRIFDRQFNDNQVAELAGFPRDPVPTEPYVKDALLLGTDSGERLEASAHGVTNVHGGYGDDTLIGSNNNDVLDGGHGQDMLSGGAGDDILYSLSDGREPAIAQPYGRKDDPKDEINSNTRTHYLYQPIEADDALIGGDGADTFHFRVLINAKRHIILKHVQKDGSINWGMNGVAGENKKVHDHWVERLGNDVIWDFNREEGDRIEVVGHTVEVYRRVHQDSDGDRIVDSTVLHLRSNQGNGGGAHNKDLLGTITVFGDLVMPRDYTIEKIEYGIVPTVAELDEAITPRVYTSISDDAALPPYPKIDASGQPELPDGETFETFAAK